MPTLTGQELRRYVELGIQAEIARLQALLKEKAAVASPSHSPAAPKTRKPLSAAARKKISQRMKARWAKMRSEKG